MPYCHEHLRLQILWCMLVTVIVMNHDHPTKLFHRGKSTETSPSIVGPSNVSDLSLFLAGVFGSWKYPHCLRGKNQILRDVPSDHWKMHCFFFGGGGPTWSRTNEPATTCFCCCFGLSLHHIISHRIYGTAIFTYYFACSFNSTLHVRYPPELLRWQQKTNTFEVVFAIKKMVIVHCHVSFGGGSIPFSIREDPCMIYFT